MKIVAISDLHGHLPTNMPDGDVLCICGDLIPLEYQKDDVASIAWFCLEFIPWTDKLSYNKVIFIAGNHDFFLEHIMLGPLKENGIQKIRTSAEVLKKLLPGNNKSKHKLIYLRDNSVEIEGIRFYGTPWISGLPNWAFNKTEEELTQKIYSTIPKKCDVLLTHMPPELGLTGTVLQSNAWNNGNTYSSIALANAIKERDIKYVFCGHVHSGEHTLCSINNKTNIANVSLLNEDYLLTYHPLIIKIK